MINRQVDLALDFLENTKVNIFLTGRAGTGKTTFLHNLKVMSPKRMVIVAPTGVAAINAKGVTIHSFFQLSFGLYVPDAVRKESAFNKFNKTKINIIKSMDLLVIDEISMVRADLLDAIDDVLRRYRDKSRPFGGVQLLMIGDLQQLSPVVKNEDWELLKDYYNTPYFFGSKALQKSGYRVIELKHIYRQSDEKFINLLSKVRNGEMDKDALDMLNGRYIADFKPKKEDGYITLTSHNHLARTINDTKLAELSEDEYVFEAKVIDTFPEYLYPVDSKLVLKKGAQVMFCKNDTSSAKKYVNGSIGEITKISNNGIEVQLSESKEIISVELAEWENTKYTIDKDTKEIIETIEGVFKQYPLKTAWAITIHKSQGLTFDRVIIDAANSFSHGQVYVALSRCRTLEGVVLETSLRYNSVKNDPIVKEYNCDAEKLHPTAEQLAADKQLYYKSLLIELFDFNQLLINIRQIRRILNENLVTVYPKLIERWNVTEGQLRIDLEDVYIKFKMQIERLMQNDDYLNDNLLNERIKKGAQYFSEKLASLVTPLYESLNIDIDNKEVKKNLGEVRGRFEEALAVKNVVLDLALKEFTVKDYLSIKAKATLSKSEKVKEELTNSDNVATFSSKDKIEIDMDNIDDVIDKELFVRLRNWRTDESKKKGVAAYVIAHQKVIIAIAVTSPTSIKELKRIKGIGKVFIEKYGQTIIDIVLQKE